MGLLGRETAKKGLGFLVDRKVAMRASRKGQSEWKVTVWLKFLTFICTLANDTLLHTPNLKEALSLEPDPPHPNPPTAHPNPPTAHPNPPTAHPNPPTAHPLYDTIPTRVTKIVS